MQPSLRCCSAVAHRSREARFPPAAARRHRSVPRDTDCLPRAGRCSREHLSGVRGHDGGDAGVRSCNAEGQGGIARVSQWRSRVLLLVRLVLDAVAPSLGTALAFGPCGGWPRGSRAVTEWCDATRCCASIVRRRGSLTRGRAMVLQGRGASSRLVHPSQTGHWDATHRCSASRTRNRGRTTGRHEYRQCARFAQPTLPSCELRARSTRMPNAPRGTPPCGAPTRWWVPHPPRTAGPRPRCGAPA